MCFTGTLWNSWINFVVWLQKKEVYDLVCMIIKPHMFFFSIRIFYIKELYSCLRQIWSNVSTLYRQQPDASRKEKNSTGENYTSFWKTKDLSGIFFSPVLVWAPILFHDVIMVSFFHGAAECIVWEHYSRWKCMICPGILIIEKYSTCQNL